MSIFNKFINNLNKKLHINVMDNISYLNNLKEQIENMEKYHQIEILKILSNHACKINENKSGVYVNMTYLSDDVIKDIKTYLDYVMEQEDTLTTTECQKKEFLKSYFTDEKEHI